MSDIGSTVGMPHLKNHRRGVFAPAVVSVGQELPQPWRRAPAPELAFVRRERRAAERRTVRWCRDFQARASQLRRVAKPGARWSQWLAPAQGCRRLSLNQRAGRMARFRLPPTHSPQPAVAPCRYWPESPGLAPGW